MNFKTEDVSMSEDYENSKTVIIYTRKIKFYKCTICREVLNNLSGSNILSKLLV